MENLPSNINQTSETNPPKSPTDEVRVSGLNIENDKKPVPESMPEKRTLRSKFNLFTSRFLNAVGKNSVKKPNEINEANKANEVAELNAKIFSLEEELRKERERRVGAERRYDISSHEILINNGEINEKNKEISRLRQINNELNNRVRVLMDDLKNALSSNSTPTHVIELDNQHTKNISENTENTESNPDNNAISEAKEGILSPEGIPLNLDDIFDDENTVEVKKKSLLYSSFYFLGSNYKKIKDKVKKVVDERKEKLKNKIENNENKEEREKKINKILLNTKEWYKKQPTSVKLAISGTLIGASMLGVATGSTVIVAGATVGKLAMRAMGSYIAGESVESLLQKKFSNINNNEKKIRLAKYGTMVAAFLVGSYSDISSYLGDTNTGGILGNVEVQSDNQTGSVSMPRDIREGVSVSRDIDPFGTTLSHQIFVKEGDTFSKILLRDGLFEVFKPEDIKSLSLEGKQNLIGNIVNKLTKDQLIEIGITSGNKDILMPGETIDVKKLADIVKAMEVKVGGQKMSLFSRAFGIS